VSVSVLLLAVAGCETPPPAVQTEAVPKKQHLPPVLQRMRDTYEDLASGRFVSLADFETPGQETLFRCAGPDGTDGNRPQPTLSILRSRNETGGMSLKARLSAPEDRLVCDGQRARERALVRDWHDYALLLMSIYGPPQGALLEFSLQSGQFTPLRWTRTLQIDPGWNLIRLDLAAAGERINLADVRALIWRAPQIAAPLDLYIDDVLIADNTQQVLGQQAGPGELYTFTRGRRIYVGARERFELAFADGHIVAWRSGGDVNLADPDGLGPWPVPLAADWATAQSPSIAYDDPNLYATWGASAATTQRVVEATPFRVVIAGRWRFMPNGPSSATAPAASGGPSHTWQYAIYPAGAVYVSIQSSAPPTGWTQPRVGYAIALDGRRDFRRVEPPRGEPEPDNGFVLMARPGGERADCLWAWPRATELARHCALASADERRLAIIAGDVAAAPLVQTAQLFRLWPTDIDDVPEARSFAADYRNPVLLTPAAGRLITDAPGDFDHDGYNESEGVYEVAFEHDALRFDFARGQQLRYDPVFRVHDTAGRRCWVYARGRLLSDVGRDVNDNLLFRLGRVTSAPVAIEVHTTPADGAP
jgi:hypothetical protein